jgi:hypothetical protein
MTRRAGMTRRVGVTRRVGISTATDVLAEDKTEVAVELEDVTAAGMMAANTAQAEAMMAMADTTVVVEDATEDVTELKDVTKESV